ncbi:MAG TPA: DUF2059 domain-containing protein [Sphingomonas sp.]
MIVKTLAMAAALMPLSAMAQTSAPAPAAAVAAPVEPARLTAARKLIDEILPPEKRDAMIDAMIRPMMANLRDSMAQSPDMAALFQQHPAMRDQMLQFLDGETERSLRVAHETMPALFDAMAIAYARQFTLDQLADMERFFTSPTGKIYMERVPAVMADPAVTAAQRTMMDKAFDGLQDRIKSMAQKMQDAAGKEGKS